MAEPTAQLLEDFVKNHVDISDRNHAIRYLTQALDNKHNPLHQSVASHGMTYMVTNPEAIIAKLQRARFIEGDQKDEDIWTRDDPAIEAIIMQMVPPKLRGKATTTIVQALGSKPEVKIQHIWGKHHIKKPDLDLDELSKEIVQILDEEKLLALKRREEFVQQGILTDQNNLSVEELVYRNVPAIGFSNARSRVVNVLNKKGTISFNEDNERHYFLEDRSPEDTEAQIIELLGDLDVFGPRKREALVQEGRLSRKTPLSEIVAKYVPEQAGRVQPHLEQTFRFRKEKKPNSQIARNVSFNEIAKRWEVVGEHDALESMIARILFRQGHAEDSIELRRQGITRRSYEGTGRVAREEPKVADVLEEYVAAQKRAGARDAVLGAKIPGVEEIEGGAYITGNESQVTYAITRTLFDEGYIQPRHLEELLKAEIISPEEFAEHSISGPLVTQILKDYVRVDRVSKAHEKIRELGRSGALSGIKISGNRTYVQGYSPAAEHDIKRALYEEGLVARTHYQELLDQKVISEDELEALKAEPKKESITAPLLTPVLEAFVTTTRRTDARDKLEELLKQGKIEGIERRGARMYVTGYSPAAEHDIKRALYEEGFVARTHYQELLDQLVISKDEYKALQEQPRAPRKASAPLVTSLIADYVPMHQRGEAMKCIQQALGDGKDPVLTANVFKKGRGFAYASGNKKEVDSRLYITLEHAGLTSDRRLAKNRTYHPKTGQELALTMPGNVPSETLDYQEAEEEPTESMPPPMSRPTLEARTRSGPRRKRNVMSDITPAALMLEYGIPGQFLKDVVGYNFSEPFERLPIRTIEITRTLWYGDESDDWKLENEGIVSAVEASSMGKEL